MAFKRDWVRDWIDAVAPGEQLVSYVVAAMWTPVVVKGTFKRGVLNDGLRADTLLMRGDAVMNERLAERAADPAMAVAPSASGVFYALTDRRLLLGGRSALRNRPQDLLHSAPSDAVTVYWFDHDESGGNRFRHLLIDFGDGRWRRDRSGLQAMGKDLRATSNVEEFFAALGPRGHEIDSTL